MSQKVSSGDSIEEGELEDGEIEDDLPILHKKLSSTYDVQPPIIRGENPQHFQFQTRRHMPARTFPQQNQMRTPNVGFWPGNRSGRMNFASPGARLLGAGNRGQGRGRGRARITHAQRFLPEYGGSRGRGHLPRGGNQPRSGRGRGAASRNLQNKNLGPTRRKPQDKGYRHHAGTESDEDERLLEKTRDSFEELLREHKSIQAKLEALEEEEERTQKLLSSDTSDKLNVEQKFKFKDAEYREPIGERNTKGPRSRRVRRRSRAKPSPTEKVAFPKPTETAIATPTLQDANVDEDDEEISELELRLIALASASKKVAIKAEEEEAERQELEEEMRASEITDSDAVKMTSDANGRQVQVEVSPSVVKNEQTKRMTRRERNRNRRLKRKINQQKRQEEEWKRREAAEIRSLQNGDEQYSRFLKFVGKGQKEIQSRMEATEIRNLQSGDEQYSRFLKFVGKGQKEIESRMEATEIRNLQSGDEQYSRFLKFVGKGQKEIESRMEATEIRQLTNEDEKYKRFMKFVQREEKDGKLKKSRSSSSHEASETRQTLQFQEAAPLNVSDPDYNFQFDNYDEVEMDVDSSENSSMVAASPVPFLVSGSIEQPSKPPLSFETIPMQTHPEGQEQEISFPVFEPSGDHGNSEDEEEDVLALREQLLKSMASKRASKVTEDVKVPVVEAVSSPRSVRSLSPMPGRSMSPSLLVSVPGNYAPPPMASAASRRNVPVSKMQIPKHERVVITLGQDSDSSDTESEDSKPSVVPDSLGFGIDMFLKEARKNVDASKAKLTTPMATIGKTPEAVDRLSAHQKAEYRRLKQEIALREHRKKIDGGRGGSANASPSISDVDTQEDVPPKEIVVQKLPLVAQETVAKQQAASEEALKNVEETETKLQHIRKLLRKDQQVMVKLDSQMNKKQSAVQFIVNRIQKLKEQLQATEDVLHANTVAIQKLETHRVNLSSRIEKRSSLEGKLLAKVNQLRQAAGLKELSLGAWVDAEGPEGNMQSTQLSLKSPRKTAAVTQVSVPKKAAAVPKKMTSEQIAKEKERLQRLEREFAEKIKKLREVQALTEAKNTATESSNLTNNGALQRLAEIRMQSASLKPSMQEYKKDKISLDVAIETEEADNEGPQVKKRRKSLLEMNPSTKPNLITAKEKSKNVDTPTAADVKATLAGKTELIAADKENITQFKSGEQTGKQSKENQPKKSMVFSLPSEPQLDRLRRLQQEKEKVVKFESVWTQQRQDFPRDYVSLPPLRLEMDKAGANLNSTDTMQGLGTIKTVQYKPYESPLQLFKSYRFNPYYRTKAKLSLSSVTFSNKINPHRIMCRFDIKGTCNDEGCRWQHKEDYNLTKEELFQDIVSFAPRLAGVKDMENITEHEERVSEYVNTLYKQNGEKMTADQMCLLFVSKVNDHHKNVAPHTMMYERRKWKPRQSVKKQQEKDDDSSADIKMPDRKSKKYMSSLDTTFTEDDPRYFTMDGVVCQDLESAVMEHPTDVQLWLKLAYQQLSRQDSESDSLDKALNVLSRGLESNGGSPELWQHYLTLFAKRGSANELREMCQEAVHFAPHYDVWSKCLELEKTFSGKDDLCKKILAFLKKRQEENFSNLQSHQLLETLLHRIHLHVQTRRYSIALNVFSTSLMDKSKSSGDSSCLGHLLAPNDRCLAWLSFIYLTQFHTLPPSLYDPINSNPAKIVSKEPFILPWTEDSDLKPEVLLGHFQNALDACIDHTQPAELNTLICLPLYKNVLKMKTLLDRYDAAETLCRQILKDSPFVVEQWLMLADLHVLNNQTEQSRKVFEEAIVENPFSVELYYSAATFELSQQNPEEALSLLSKCVQRLFHCEGMEEQPATEDLYRKLLGQTVSLESLLPSLTEDIVSETSTQQLYLWLSYCLVLELRGNDSGCVEAYETSLYALKSHTHVQRVWIQYLKYQSRKASISTDTSRDRRIFTDLINRCLVTMPTQFHPPFSTTTLWSDYSFHNSVVEMYLECLREEDWSIAYEGFLRMMPSNAVLAVRACQHEWKIGNSREAERICSAFLTRNPFCLPMWKVAISLELKEGNHKEAHQMYWSATQALPFSATLWKDFILCEVAHSTKAEDVKDVIDACQQIGINIDDYIATILK